MELTLLTTEEINRVRALTADAFDPEHQYSGETVKWLCELVTRVANDAKAANEQLNRSNKFLRLLCKELL